MSILGREISNLLLRKTEWECTKHVLTHIPTGLKLWISNGAWFFDVDTNPGAIGLIERHWLWWSRAYKLVVLLKPHDPTSKEQQQKVWERIKGSNVKVRGCAPGESEKEL